MDARIRRIITRIKPLHRLCRVALYNSGIFYYRKKYRQENYAQFFDKIHNSKVGKRCFIIGNGPSLKASDLDKIVDEDCFAANCIFLIFPQTPWRPTYYTIGDRYAKITSEQLEDVGADTIFLGDYFCRFNDVWANNAVCLHQHIQLSDKNCKVSPDISKYVTNCATVSFLSMQVAAYMGYSEIYLLGFDHNYKREFTRSGAVVVTGASRSHFFEETDTSVKPEDVIGEMNGMTRAYEAFRDYAKEHGITVKNATRGGKLEVFERVDFDSLFEGKTKEE